MYLGIFFIFLILDMTCFLTFKPKYDVKNEDGNAMFVFDEKTSCCMMCTCYNSRALQAQYIYQDIRCSKYQLIALLNWFVDRFDRATYTVHFISTQTSQEEIKYCQIHRRRTPL